MTSFRSLSRWFAQERWREFWTPHAPLVCSLAATAPETAGISPGIEILAPADGTFFAISPEPAMPRIQALARIVGITPDPTSTTGFEWSASIRFDSAACPHGCKADGTSRVIAGPAITETVVGGAWTPRFPSLLGGELSLTVRATVAGESWQAGSHGLRIEAVNPGCSELLAALPHDTLRRIACHESGLRQFMAARDRGQGFSPLFSGDKLLGAGIFQITNPSPTDEQIWNWRENVAAGIATFNSKIAVALAYPQRVETAQGFQELAAKTNRMRRAQGLPEIQIKVPPFTRGNFQGNLQQLEDDVIRGYNGWGGRDQFHLALHEFRVKTNADGSLALHIDPQQNTGTAIWERVPASQRPQSGDPDYVRHIKSISLASFAS
jgi:hypothetical protein